MGPQRAGAVVLDAGAFIAFERNDRRIRRLVELASEHARPLHAPAGVVAQVWRDGARQVRLARLINSGQVDVWVLDLETAKAAGALCGSVGTADIVDATVVLLARGQDATVVTSDPADIRRLDSSLQVVSC